MPTSDQEVETSIDIILQYIPARLAEKIFGHLWEDVGSKSDNSSVKASYYGLYAAIRACVERNANRCPELQCEPGCCVDKEPGKEG